MNVRYTLFLTFLMYILLLNGVWAFVPAPEYPTYASKGQCFDAVFERYQESVLDIEQNVREDAQGELLEAAEAVHHFEHQACEKTYLS